MKYRLGPWPLLLTGLLLVILFFSLLETPEGRPVREFFLTFDNFKFIASQAAIIGIGALGMTLILANGSIDLSAGAIITFAATLALYLLQSQLSPWAVFGTVLAVGILIGILNALLISLLKIPSFIVTLGMAGIVGGAAQSFIPLSRDPVPSSWLRTIIAPFESWFIFAPAVWLTILAAVGLALLFRNTVFGRHLLAMGANPETAELYGVRLQMTRFFVFALGAALFALGGLFQAGITSNPLALAKGGPAVFGLTLDILAAVAIGGGIFFSQRTPLFGVLFGALLIALLRNGSQQAGWHPASQAILIGSALVLAVALRRLTTPPAPLPPSGAPRPIL